MMYGEYQKWWMLDLSNLCHCIQHPGKLTSRHFWCSRKERNPLFQQKCVFLKCCGVSQKQWMLELSNLCHCIQHPWKTYLVGISGSSRKERNPHFQQKCVFRKCCGVSQKQWMLEHSNLCHCVQNPWKLTSRDDCSTKNERKPLSTLKHVWETVNSRVFKPLPLCSAPLKTS